MSDLVPGPHTEFDAVRATLMRPRNHPLDEGFTDPALSGRRNDGDLVEFRHRCTVDKNVTGRGADHADEVAERFAILRIARQEDKHLGIGAPLLQLGRQRIRIRGLEPIGLVFVVQRLHNGAQLSDHVRVVDP
ncbi:MAG TPA: hypothetical protein VGR26_07750, partial [Acidimicrobiales bacterium]|nr:hypothetical protein [Acidimicrobiales bacterium]